MPRPLKCCKTFLRFLVQHTALSVLLLLCLYLICLPSPNYDGGSRENDGENIMVDLDWLTGKNAWSLQDILEPLKVRRNETTTSQGYLLVVDYAQQLMGGFMGFYHLANITSLLNLTSVEPYVRDSGLEGVPLYYQAQLEMQALRMRSFYDLDNLRSLLKSCCLGVDLVSFKTFVERASHEVVLIAFLHSLKNHEHYFSNGNKIVELEDGTPSLLNSLHVVNRWIGLVSKKQKWDRVRYRLSAPFRLSRTILIDARPLNPLPLAELVDKLGSVVREQAAKFGSVTFILDTWRDVQGKFPSAYFYSFPGFKWKNCDDMDTVKLSQLVVGTAERFRNKLDEIAPVVGVHIRAERLLLDYRGSVAHYINCLRQLKSLLTNGTILYKSVYVFHDLGKYGSNSCTYNYCSYGKPHFLYVLKRLGYRMVHYDPAQFHPASLRRAFAGFVEMEYLSNVDVLVTVGRGAYQDHVVQRYLKNHRGRDSNLYRICHNPPPPPQSVLFSTP